jgi:Putative MetA-pathway of phenol degradation
MKGYKIVVASLVLCLIMVLPGTVRAWDARDYVPAPAGTNLLIAYYKSASGNQYYSGNNRVGDVNIDANVGILRAVYFMKVPGTNIIMDPQFLLPYGYQNINSPALGIPNSTTSGLGDLILACTFWFVNDPANKMWFGVTPYIFAPTGDYDSTRAINLGANRWAGRLEAGFVKGFGNWFVDVGGGIEAYTDNDRVGVINQTKKQDPVYDLQLKLTYDFTKTVYGGLEYQFIGGGTTKLGGADQNDRREGHLAKVITSYWITPQYQIQATYEYDMAERNGPKVNTLGFRLLHAF